MMIHAMHGSADTAFHRPSGSRIRTVRRGRKAALAAALVLSLCFTFPAGVCAVTATSASAPAEPDPYAGLGITLTATSAVVIETGRGTELYASRAAENATLPAVSKIMTALLVLQRFQESTFATISLTAQEANQSADEGSRIDGFAAGDKYTVEFLIAAMLYIDSDAAAIALAELHSGDEASFVGIMNARAAQLGMTSTVFLNSSGRSVSSPTGQDGETEVLTPVSTPKDAALLIKYFLQNDNFATTVNTAFKTASTRFFPTGGSSSIEISNRLAHAWTFVDNLTGVFMSDDSGIVSLVATYSAGGFEILVVLGGVTPGSEIQDLQQIGRRIYANYINSILVRAGQTVPETFRDTVDGEVFGLKYKRTVYYVQRIGEGSVSENMSYTSAGPHSLPLMTDDTVGTMLFTFRNGTSISVECAPDRTIYSVASTLMDRILNAFQANPDLYTLILICSGMFVLTVLHRTATGAVRLYWRIRLRLSVKTAGPAMQEQDREGNVTRGDADAGHKE